MLVVVENAFLAFAAVMLPLKEVWAFDVVSVAVVSSPVLLCVVACAWVLQIGVDALETWWQRQRWLVGQSWMQFFSSLLVETGASLLLP